MAFMFPSPTALIYRNLAGVLGNLTYAYDAAGNRTGIGGSFARALLPGAIASATYDAANRQITLGDKQMAFDANGNLTVLTEPSGTTTFFWDTRDRLAIMMGPNLIGHISYYSFGRRIDPLSTTIGLADGTGTDCDQLQL